jgi:hypothetical protein
MKQPTTRSSELIAGPSHQCNQEPEPNRPASHADLWISDDNSAEHHQLEETVNNPDTNPLEFPTYWHLITIAKQFPKSTQHTTANHPTTLTHTTTKHTTTNVQKC